MRRHYRAAIEVMTDAFVRLEASIEPPVQVLVGDSIVFRYREKGIPQALVQKLARNVSGLNALLSFP